MIAPPHACSAANDVEDGFEFAVVIDEMTSAIRFSSSGKTDPTQFLHSFQPHNGSFHQPDSLRTLSSWLYNGCVRKTGIPAKEHCDD